MKLRRVLGSILIVISGVSIVQSTREYLLWESGDGVEQRDIRDRAFRFAGRSFTVEDEHPYIPRRQGEYNSEAAVPGTIRLTSGGSVLGAPSRAEVRPGRNDLGRYHTWFDAAVFRDTRSGDSVLWMARRIQPEGSRPVFEVVTVSADGTQNTRVLRAYQLGQSYPLFRSTQFLRGSTFFVVPLSVLEFFVFPPLLLLFPFGALALGIVLARMQEIRL